MAEANSLSAVVAKLTMPKYTLVVKIRVASRYEFKERNTIEAEWTYELHIGKVAVWGRDVNRERLECLEWAWRRAECEARGWEYKHTAAANIRADLEKRIARQKKRIAQFSQEVSVA